MSLLETNRLKSLLLIDDEEASLELYSKLLKEQLKTNIIATKYPTQALNFAFDYLFDIILIDITINYHGSQFGGFDIYKSLINRYGDSSIIAYSKYITDDLLKQYNFSFNFLEAGINPIQFINKITNKLLNLRINQKCFVAMPFESRYDEIYSIINYCVQYNNYQCIRLDKQAFNKSIIIKIFDEISNSKFLILLATGKNPNAFYECGFAHALKKEIITITDFYKNLPFNIRDRNAIAYSNNITNLENLLMERLKNLTVVDSII